MARKLVVEVIGDTSNLSRALREGEVSSRSFGSALGGVLKMGAIAAGVGIGIAAVAITKFAKAAMEEQASQAALSTALKATHQSVEEMTPSLEAAANAALKLGFSDEDARAALTKLEIATGDTKKSIEDLSVVEDIARLKHISLSDAATMLDQAMTGSQRAVKQLGIVISPVTDAMDALKAANDGTTKGLDSAVIAHAKLQDKMATGQAVIEKTTELVHGQAKAFADTAAGEMEVFKAQLSDMADKIGVKLLPAITGVVSWVNDHWPEITAVIEASTSAIGRAIDFIGPYIRKIIDWSREAIDYVRAHWSQISEVISGVMETIGSIITQVTTAAKAIWQQFGDAITQIAQRTFPAVIRVIQDFARILQGVFELIGDLIHGRWGQVWDDLKQIVSNTLDAVETILRTAIANILTAAKALGVAIIHGIQAGLENLAGYVYEKLLEIPTALKTAAMAVAGFALQLGLDVVSGIINGLGGLADALASKLIGSFSDAWGRLKSWLGISSASKKARDEIGVEVGAGVIEGILLGLIDMPAKMNEKLKAALEAAKVTIQAEQSKLTEAFDRMGQLSIQAFEGASSAALDKMQTTFDAHVKRAITDPLDKALAYSATRNDQILSQIQARGEQMTDAEKKLSDMQIAHQKAADAERLANDRAALAEAMALQIQDGESQLDFMARRNAAIKTAQDAVNEDLYQAQLASQQKKADAARTAADAKTAALEKHQAAIFDTEQTWIQKIFDAELSKMQETHDMNVKNYQSLRDAHEYHLGLMLQTLGAELAKHPGKWKEIHEQVMDAFRNTYGPDFKTVAANMGQGFADSLMDSMGSVQARAGQLMKNVTDEIRLYVPHSPAKKGGLKELPNWEGYLLGGLAGAGAKATALIGGIGSPGVGAAGRGGGDIYLTVHGFVGDEQALTDRVLSALRRETTRTPSLGLT